MKLTKKIHSLKFNKRMLNIEITDALNILEVIFRMSIFSRFERTGSSRVRIAAIPSGTFATLFDLTHILYFNNYLLI